MLYNLIILQAYIIMIILNLIKHKLVLILGWILHCFQNKKNHFLSGLILIMTFLKLLLRGITSIILLLLDYGHNLFLEKNNFLCHVFKKYIVNAKNLYYEKIFRYFIFYRYYFNF